MSALFRDRADAGERLADVLVSRDAELRLDRPLVAALPRGGVPVAAAIAAKLGGDLGVLPVRKIGTPGQRELALGAVALGGEPVWNEQLVSRLGYPTAVLDELAARAKRELDEQAAAYAGALLAPEACRPAVVVDDGLATGASARAALAAVAAHHPSRLVLAVPVAAPSSVAALTGHPVAGQKVTVVAVAAPEQFSAVGGFYADFRQVSEDDVRRLLGLDEAGR